MTQWFLRCGALMILLQLSAPISAVPLPVEKKDGIVADRANFIPYRKHMALPGKIIAVLVTDAQPALTSEGRVGPSDQLCIGWNGGSYRWAYVSTDEKAAITNLAVPLPEGKTKVYPKLNMASPATVKHWGVDKLYSLVEVEVNEGAGSPAHDAFVATRMTRLDGTKDFPLQVADTIEDLKKRYDAHLSEKQKDLDAAIIDLAKKELKDRELTGPREKNTVMYITWKAETEKLQVRFLSKITDGAYKYAKGINIEWAPVPVPNGPPQGGAAPPPRLENGLRFGALIGVTYGVQYEVSKSGKIDSTKIFETQSFQKTLPEPRFGRGPNKN